MADYTKYTKQEMQAYAIAKNIKENQIVIVGTGLPLIGASLAKRWVVLRISILALVLLEPGRDLV